MAQEVRVVLNRQIPQGAAYFVEQSGDQMFAVNYARDRAAPPYQSPTEAFSELIRATWEDFREDLNRQILFFDGIPPNRVKKLIQKDCPVSMFGRLHDWSEPERHPTRLCYQCDGTKQYPEDGYMVDCDLCNEWGYIEGYSSRRCNRCNAYETTNR